MELFTIRYPRDDRSLQPARNRRPCLQSAPISEDADTPTMLNYPGAGNSRMWNSRGEEIEGCACIVAPMGIW